MTLIEGEGAGETRGDGADGVSVGARGGDRAAASAGTEAAICRGKCDRDLEGAGAA